MPDMPLTPEDEAQVDKMLNIFKALLLMPSRTSYQLSAYKGTMNGEEVIIIAAMAEQGDGNMQSKPLFVMWNEAVHKAVEVPHATKVDWPGTP